jgi:hypothetical protein
MGITDKEAKDFLVTRLGLSGDMADRAVNLGKIAGAVSTGVGWVIVAYDFINKFFGPEDPVWGKLESILSAIKTVLANQDADKLSEILNDVNGSKEKIKTAGSAALTYRDTPSADSRQKLYDNLTDPDGLQTALGNLLQGKTYRFIPLAYADPNIPAWVNGLTVSGDFLEQPKPNLSEDYTGFEGPQEVIIPIQVYEQPDNPLPPIDWDPSYLDHGDPNKYMAALPAPLLKKGNRDWDGLVCLPVIFYGLPTWQSALVLLEPFHRLTGQWWQYIDSISAGMQAFGSKWKQAVLWTREMPSWSEVKTLFDDPRQPSGFFSWPCGVLDPIMGVEILNVNWWKATKTVPVLDSEGNKIGATSVPEFFTDEQRSTFKQQRLIQSQKLDDQNGYAAFMTIVTNVGKLNTPPANSPSLKVDPDHLHIEYPSPGPLILTLPQYEEVTDPIGTVWSGDVVRSSVTATVPISVQPNPKPAPPHHPRAVSDVVFGYEATVTPTGGNEQNVLNFPLRVADSEPSLYHDQDGNLKLPSPISHKFSKLPADTWKTITDGKQRDKFAIAPGSVAFDMTVTVTDGALLIKINADAEANQRRSFALAVRVKETAAVDANGYPKNNPLCSKKFKTYTSEILIPVDIYRIYVSEGYFDWFHKALERLRHVGRALGIPGPHPDHDPILELSLWRLVLEGNPALLQAYTLDLRRSTSRLSLMPKQVLEHVDHVLNKLGGQKVSKRLAYG